MFYNAIKEKMKQITNTILMIQPVVFRFNEQTAENNYYQKINNIGRFIYIERFNKLG